jgi:hypothetical protein
MKYEVCFQIVEIVKKKIPRKLNLGIRSSSQGLSQYSSYSPLCKFILPHASLPAFKIDMISFQLWKIHFYSIKKNASQD